MSEKDAINEAATLLRKASDVLFALESKGGPKTHEHNQGASSSSSSSDNSQTTTSNAVSPHSQTVSQTLARARAMMHISSSRGTFRRLNQNERLRASLNTQSKKATSKKKNAPVEDKPFEFALIKSEEDPEEQSETLKRNMVIARGIVILAEGDGESEIREKIVSSLKEKYSMLGPRDFEFIKVTQKKISVMNLSKGTEYNYAVLKKMIGQGTLYIRMKPEYQCIVDEKDDDNSFFNDSDHNDDDYQFSTSVFDQPDCNSRFSQDSQQQPVPSINQTCQTILDHVKQDSKTNDEFFNQIVREFPPTIIEPTEMLMYLQNKIVIGRPLEVTDETTSLEGETNYITVDRDDILKTTFEELKSVKNPRVTFEVQFYGEQAFDSGGPRKEWIRLCNQNIKAKYFDQGLKEHLSHDYFYVGQMAGIAILQNGQRPMYFPEEILRAVFNGDIQHASPCLKELHKGMSTLGLPQFGQKFPIFLHLFRPTNTRLTVKIMTSLLKPKFSDTGSNALPHEKVVYGKLVKYMREVEAGRRVVSLENILEFVTGSSEEPTLGFALSPNIEFVKAYREYNIPQVEMPLTSQEGETWSQLEVQQEETQETQQVSDQVIDVIN